MIRLINDFAVLYAESTGCAREILSELWRSNNIMDHLSRFQVITKVPYPSLGDSWIDEKRKRSEQWYSWQTGLRLVQAYGRSVRSKDDWAATYVLDSAFGNFVA